MRQLAEAIFRSHFRPSLDTFRHIITLDTSHSESTAALDVLIYLSDAHTEASGTSHNQGWTYWEANEA